MMKKTLKFIPFLFLVVACSTTPEEDPIPDVDIDDVVNVTPPDTMQIPLEPIPFDRIPCENGLAGSYPCNGYDLLSHLPVNTFSARTLNDNWGWTDPETGKEYVLQGLNNGVAFVDISDPGAPIFLGNLPTQTDQSTWRDVKVYNNHAFIVSEAFGHGLQVFDLTRLRNLTYRQTFTADATLQTFGNAHNIAINEASGFAYVIGSQEYSGGPYFIDIQNPTQPRPVGGYAASSYSHDAHIITYNGPDTEHVGKEILLGSNSDGGSNNQLVIVDVTDKESPRLLSRAEYPNGGYTHQAWMDPAHRFAYLGDELDESNFGHRTKTLVFDLSDLDQPVLHHTYLGPSAAIDHNGYVKGDAYYLSNYSAGFREINVQDIANGNMTEDRFFDTFPNNNATNFDGVWNIYPFFESGVIAISDIDGGLFLVKRSEE